MERTKRLARFTNSTPRTATEVAKYLGVSRQRAYVLLKRFGTVVSSGFKSGRAGRPAALYVVVNDAVKQK